MKGTSVRPTRSGLANPVREHRPFSPRDRIAERGARDATGINHHIWRGVGVLYCSHVTLRGYPEQKYSDMFAKIFAGLVRCERAAQICACRELSGRDRVMVRQLSDEHAIFAFELPRHVYSEMRQAMAAAAVVVLRAALYLTNRRSGEAMPHAWHALVLSSTDTRPRTTKLSAPNQ